MLALNDLLEKLTAAQRQAVTHCDGPLLILAGPGSGKTRVLTHRVAYLLEQGVPARNILALTFTNKAAQEMLSRVQNLCEGAEVWMGTFHRFCARLLRQHAQGVGLESSYSIYDTADSQAVLKRVLKQKNLELMQATPGRIANRISTLKNNCQTEESFRPRPGDPLDAVVAEVYPLYQKALRDANAVDFDDLLLHVVTLLKENPELRASFDRRYRYVLVDEYQDTNLAQYALARGLSIHEPNLCVVGDPDQSIYGWRGANLNNILDFERDFTGAKIVRLEQNYRSTKCILRVASALISHNRKRKDKSLYTENSEGEPVHWTMYRSDIQEAEAIAESIATQMASGQRRPRDFAILYRINALSRRLELALRKRNIRYQVLQGQEFFQRSEVKDLLAYLQLLNNPRDDAAFLRIINNPPRGIGIKSLKRLSCFAADYEIPLFAAAERVQEIPGLPKKAAASLARFVDLCAGLVGKLTLPVAELCKAVLSETGYQDQFDPEDENHKERRQNLDELVNAAADFDTLAQVHGSLGSLEGFLEEISLVSDTDQLDPNEDRVKLMTLHAAKGLEFPVVYLVALEQGLLPHDRSQEWPEMIEEERRLLFVGITRAMQELWLSQARFRTQRGMNKMTIPSEFMRELPSDDICWHTELSEGETEYFDDLPAEDFSQELAEDPNSPTDDQAAGLLRSLRKAARHEGPPRQPASDSATNSETSQPTDSQNSWGGFITAADLARQSGEDLNPNGFPRQQPSANSSSPRKPAEVNDFKAQMVVRHPQYGLGKIVAVSGNGRLRRATVRFASEAGEKRFVIANSPLELVGQADS